MEKRMPFVGLHLKVNEMHLHIRVFYMVDKSVYKGFFLRFIYY